MDYISGEILTEEGLKKGYVGFEGEKILEQGKSSLPKKPLCKGLIVPSFVNAHTHIGDSFIKDKITNLPRDVEKLVAPPNGLKHKLLKNADGEDIIEGMEKSIDIMLKNGVGHFCDFRENGIRGICQMKSAM